MIPLFGGVNATTWSVDMTLELVQADRWASKQLRARVPRKPQRPHGSHRCATCKKWITSGICGETLPNGESAKFVYFCDETCLHKFHHHIRAVVKEDWTATYRCQCGCGITLIFEPTPWAFDGYAPACWFEIPEHEDFGLCPRCGEPMVLRKKGILYCDVCDWGR